MAEPCPYLKYDLSKFQWQSPASGSKRVIREAGGGELLKDIWVRYCQGECVLFFGLYLNLAKPVREALLTVAGKRAWTWLRFHIPGIALKTEADQEGKAIIVYDIPSGEAEVESWAGRTFRVAKQPILDLDKLRYELGPQRIPSEAGDQSFLYLVPGAANSDGDVTSFGLLIHTHHIAADAAGLKQWMNRYLARLSTVLTEERRKSEVFARSWINPIRYIPFLSRRKFIPEIVKETIPWGQETENLLPHVSQVLHPSEAVPIPTASSEVPTGAHPYYASFSELFNELIAGPAHARGLRHRDITQLPGSPAVSEWPQTCRQFLRFTKDESDIILKRRRPEGEKPGYTVNQIAHAALAMTIIKDNPPTSSASSDELIYFNGIVDGRSRLTEPYSSLGGYPGHSLTMSAISVPVQSFQAEDGTMIPLDKDAFVMTCRRMREQYARQKAYPSLLSSVAQECELLVGGLKAMVAAGNPPPPSYSPWFSADGIGEKHLDASFRDSEGATVLEVDRFFVSLNRTEPGPFFRIYSWKGILELSADSNERLMPRAAVESLLAEWKKYMLMVSQFEDGDYQ